MLKFLASSMLYRRLGRAIPNPIVRTLAIAGAGMAARRFAQRRAARRTIASPHATTPLRGTGAGHAASRIAPA